MIRARIPSDAQIRDIWARALTAALCQPVVGVVLFGSSAIGLLLEVLK